MQQLRYFKGKGQPDCFWKEQTLQIYRLHTGSVDSSDPLFLPQVPVKHNFGNFKGLQYL